MWQRRGCEMRRGAYGTDGARGGGSAGGGIAALGSLGRRGYDRSGDELGSGAVSSWRPGASVGESRCARDEVRWRFAGRGASLAALSSMWRLPLRCPGLGGSTWGAVGEGASRSCLKEGVGGSGCVCATGEFSIASFTGSNMGMAASASNRRALFVAVASRVLREGWNADSPTHSSLYIFPLGSFVSEPATYARGPCCFLANHGPSQGLAAQVHSPSEAADSVVF